MRAAEFRDFCKSLDCGFEFYYAGRMDTKKQKALGVYSLKNNDKIPLGGLENKKCFASPFSLLIHWDDNYDNTEVVSQKLLTKLQSLGQIKFRNIIIDYVQVMFENTIDVGTDEKGIFERVIEVTVFHRMED